MPAIADDRPSSHRPSTLPRPVPTPENTFRAAVVIPCFNDPFVGEAVASARHQEPLELVVIDDGSEDPAALAELDRLRADGVRVVRQENRGLSGARMRGIEETTAPLIFTLDSDDVLEPGAIARLADALEADPSAAVAWGDVATFGAASHYFKMGGRTFDPWWLTYMTTIPGTSMVRRESVLAAGGWELNEGGYEDWDLWMAMAEHGFGGTYVPGLVFRYRIHESGRMWAAAMEQHEHLYGRLRERHPALFAQRRANRARSTAPRRIRLLFPLIERLPISVANRRRLFDAVTSPVHVVAPRVEGVARRASAVAGRR